MTFLLLGLVGVLNWIYGGLGSGLLYGGMLLWLGYLFASGFKPDCERSVDRYLNRRK